MKDIGTLLHFPKHEGAQLKQNEDGSFVYQIAEKIAMTRQQKVNKEVINFLYQAYKDTDVSKVFVLDMGQFERFLKEMLPKWREEE